MSGKKGGVDMVIDYFVVPVLCFFAWIYGQWETYAEIIKESEDPVETVGATLWAVLDFVFWFPLRFYEYVKSRE